LAATFLRVKLLLDELYFAINEPPSNPNDGIKIWTSWSHGLPVAQCHYFSFRNGWLAKNYPRGVNINANTRVLNATRQFEDMHIIEVKRQQRPQFG
jgi:hypothetical protein